MNSRERVVANTVAQYLRTIINVCISLYSTRLVLDVLGQSDYGVYMLVGGVVSMVGFMTNALVVTTQRHLSFAHGHGRMNEVKTIFSNSLLIHFSIGIILLLILTLIHPFLFNYLHIDPARLDVTRNVYFITLLVLFFSLIASPYRGLFIARENIVYISIVDVADGVVKLLLVLLLLHIDADKLYVYSWMMASVAIFNFVALAVYSLYKYEESCLIPRRSDYDKSILRRLLNFALWTSYGTGCIMVRTQGIAVLLNRFLCTTIINTAYGIAMQMSGSVNFLAQSILNAMSPRVVKAESAGNRLHMLHLAALTSKYCFLLLSMVAIPLVFEMPQILSCWLGEGKVPEYAVMFCRAVLIAAVCDQLTSGLVLANQAIGRIRNYSLLVNTIKVSTLFFVWLCLYNGLPVVSTMVVYILIELVCAMVRMFYLRSTASLSLSVYSKEVFCHVVVPILVLILVGFLMVNYVNFSYRFLLTIFIAVLADILAILCFGMGQEERRMIDSYWSKMKKKAGWVR